jgi:hypothetical protein
MTPTEPHWTATLSVWLWGFPITWPWASTAGPVAAASNSPRVEPAPCPISGASEKKRNNFFQNSSRSPSAEG